MVSKVLDEFEKLARPVKPMFEPDDDKWTYAVKIIEYEALTELYLYDMKVRKKDEDAEPALANMAILANEKYETTAMQEYLAAAANNNYIY